MLRDFPPAADVPPGTAWKSPGTTWEIAGEFGHTVWRSVSIVSGHGSGTGFFLSDSSFFAAITTFIVENLPKTAAECSEVAIEVKRRIRGETAEPYSMRDPPGVPGGYVRLWVNPTIAIELGHAYAGTDAFVPAWDDWRGASKQITIERFVDTVHPTFRGRFLQSTANGRRFGGRSPV